MPHDVPTVPFISVLYREHAKYINEKVKSEDLSFGLYPLLLKIYHNEGIIQEQLAHYFHLNESTITRNLKKLENKGFIKRIPNKRTKIIKITEKGKITVKKIMDLDEKWDEKIIEIIGKNEYNNFLNDLQKISEELIGIEVFKT